MNPTSLKTPGVYIDDKNAFPNSIVAVETALPVFIGYTERIEYKGEPLKNKAVRMESFTDFEMYYGGGFQTKYDLDDKEPAEDPYRKPDFNINENPYWLTENKEKGPTQFNLYDSLKFFYQNGGGSCFILSIGTYTDKEKPFTSTTPFIAGIDSLKKETEPTMIVIPDAVLFEQNNCYRLQEYMLKHCGDQKNKVALLDLWQGYKELENPEDNPVENFRNQVSSESLSYGAAYYPWLHTTVVQASEVNYENLSAQGIKTLITICKTAIENLNESKKKELIKYIDLLAGTDKLNLDTVVSDANSINENLSYAIPEYKIVIENILKKKNLLSPSAAMAGIYTMVDTERGVWKAPANVSLSSVVSPAVLINHEQQEDLNAPIQGKSICAIIPFIGLGTMVWGARTLDTSSLDWRYINVRRTMIMLEQSIKFAVKAYVFEPNIKNTWLAIESMIANFLTNQWKMGALAGAVPDDAFSVTIGLGSTMTAEDILEGIIRITVKVALSHPGEFIVITFQQQQQKL